jgi:hypothetical protein
MRGLREAIAAGSLDAHVAAGAIQTDVT